MDKIIVFIRALAETGSITDSARAVGMSRQSAYRMKGRMNAEFTELWMEAFDVGHARRFYRRLAAKEARKQAAR